MEQQAESDAASPAFPFLGLPHHHAYTVTDLARAVADWHQVTGIGPFIVVPHVQFESLAVCGMPSTLDHTAAFAVLGEQFIELQVIHGISPQARAAYGADATGTALHHIAFAVDDADGASAQLTAAGAPRTVTASGGGLSVVQHDARQFNGARIEVHQNTEFFRAFFGQVRSAAMHWDGQRLIEPIST